MPINGSGLEDKDVLVQAMEGKTMVGIRGIFGVPGPANTELSSTQQRKAVTPAAAGQDAVAISQEAQEAAAAARLADTVERGSELRAEQVAEAKRRIEQATYRVQDVVRVVAARITKYITLT
jgi:hypothetical protein